MLPTSRPPAVRYWLPLLVLSLLLRSAPASASVVLTAFDADAEGNAIVITWSTASEFDTLGFNVWRTELPESAFENVPEAARVRVNGSLIVALGGALGSDYALVDADVLPDTTYYYWLEEIDMTTGSTMHGPRAARYSIAGTLPTRIVPPPTVPPTAAPPTPSSTPRPTVAPSRTPSATATSPATDVPPSQTATVLVSATATSTPLPAPIRQGNRPAGGVDLATATAAATVIPVATAPPTVLIEQATETPTAVPVAAVPTETVSLQSAEKPINPIASGVRPQEAPLVAEQPAQPNASPLPLFVAAALAISALVGAAFVARRSWSGRSHSAAE